MDYPRSLVIPAGLSQIPRQVAGFAEFRRAMLASIPRHPALHQWRARGDDNFGVMLIEMWAYVADGLAFYDEVISHETYLRTARRRPSLRKLTALLGYRPRPAVAATVTLAGLAEGRRPIVLPAGLAFRSSAFEDQAPQVFELENAATIHPLNNQWQLAAPVPDTLGSGGNLENFSQLLATRDCALKKDDLLLVGVGANDDNTQASTVTRIADIMAEDNQKYKELSFSPALSLPADTQPADVQVKKATQSGSLWKITVSGNPAVIAGTEIILDGLYRGIGAGKYIILEKEGEYRWFKVVENREVMMTISPAATTTVTDANGTEVTVAVAAVTAPATQLVSDAAINAISRKGKAADWNDADATRIIVHYGFVTGATVAQAAQSTVATGDDLNIAGRIEAPADGTPRFLSTGRQKSKRLCAGCCLELQHRRTFPGPGERLDHPFGDACHPLRQCGHGQPRRDGDKRGPGQRQCVACQSILFAEEKSPHPYLGARGRKRPGGGQFFESVCGWNSLARGRQLLWPGSCGSDLHRAPGRRGQFHRDLWRRPERGASAHRHQ
jgi:hypothetical protein